MQTKTIIFIIVILVIILAVVGGVYFLLGDKFKEWGNEAPVAENNEKQPPAEQNKIITDDFSIDIPSGWKQATPPSGTSAMAVYADEKITDPAVQKINFRSYMAVSYDQLKEKTLKDYAQKVKEDLSKNITGVNFIKEEELSINSNASKAMEAELNQQGVDFKVLIFVVEGKNGDVWAISYSTTRNNWNTYQDQFYETAKSFSLLK